MSCLTLLILQILDYNPILGSFLIGSCIVFMTFVVLNLFISVILVAFSEEQKHYQVCSSQLSCRSLTFVVQSLLKA